MQDEILKRLDLLAARLGLLAGQVWQFYTAQAKLDGWLDISIGCLLIVTALIAAGVANWGHKKITAHKDAGGNDYDYPDSWDFARATGLTLMFVLPVIVVVFLRIGISDIVNPGYAAFHDLVTDLTAK